MDPTTDGSGDDGSSGSDGAGDGSDAGGSGSGSDGSGSDGDGTPDAGSNPPAEEDGASKMLVGFGAAFAAASMALAF